MIFHGRNKSANSPRAPTEGLTLMDSPAGWGLEDGTASVNNALGVTAYYRAVNYIAQTIAIMPYYLFDRGTRERVTDPALLEVLTQRPNEIMSPYDFKFTRQAHRLLYGNSYAYIQRDGHNGQVQELLILPPGCVQRVFDETRNLHYLFTDPQSGDQYDLLPYQISDYKGFTLDGINGIPMHRYARYVIDKDTAARKYERALYVNGGRPSGVLYTDSDLGGMSTVMGDDGKPISKKELVRRAWNKVYAGGENAFRTAVLDLGLKYQPVAMNNNDAQFVQSVDLTVADIARISGVPLHALMSGKQSYESNVQNRVEFVQTTGLSIVTACEEEDSYKLLLPSQRAKQWRVRLNMEAAMRGNTKSRGDWYTTMRNVGAYSVNDILALEDRPSVPGGDTRTARLDGVPLENFAEISLARNTNNHQGGGNKND